MVIDELHEKQAYEIQFNANDGGNPGDLYVVLTGWVPRENGGPLPKPTENELGPGEFCRVSGTAPARADARRLRIDISVPHPTGGGTLIVTQGASHQTITVGDDAFFLSPLVP
jgi:hypothetical protein